jgi:2-phosphoglycerate kinase
MVGRLLVVTGASGVGKSTLTTRVASALEFEKVASTDTVREILRTQLGIEAEPALHRSSFQPAGSGAIEDWRATIVPLSDGIEAVIERARRRGSDLLLEGVHIAPSFTLLDDWRAAGGRACGVVLHVDDLEEHVRMIASRQEHNDRSARHYLDHIEQIRQIHDEMVRLGRENGWLLIDVTLEDDPLGAIETAMK